jgi:hypothetical protein
MQTKAAAQAANGRLQGRRAWPGSRWLTAGLLGGLGLLVGACHSPTPDPALPLLPSGWLPSQALVAEVQGAACRGKKPGDSWRKLRPGDWLPPGTIIDTVAPSQLTLQLYEAGIKVQVKPGTLLRLEKLSYLRRSDGLLTATVLDLPEGEVAVDSSNLTAGSDFEIRAPQGVTHISPPGAK